MSLDSTNSVKNTDFDTIIKHLKQLRAYNFKNGLKSLEYCLFKTYGIVAARSYYYVIL